MNVVTFRHTDAHDPRLREAEDAYEAKARAGEYVSVAGTSETTYIKQSYLERVQADLLKQQAIGHILDVKGDRLGWGA